REIRSFGEQLLQRLWQMHGNTITRGRRRCLNSLIDDIVIEIVDPGIRIPELTCFIATLQRGVFTIAKRGDDCSLPEMTLIQECLGSEPLVALVSSSCEHIRKRVTIN